MDEPHLTWKIAAVVLWASAVSGWMVAAGTLRALDRLRSSTARDSVTNGIATEACPVPYSGPRAAP